MTVFDALLHKIMLEEKSPYDFEDARSVFKYYFEQYERWTGRAHPPIRPAQIRRIVQEMPWYSPDQLCEEYPTIVPEEYPAIIDLHFKTVYRNCDYNINHFFSGRIREYRYYEVMAGYE